MRHRKEVPAPPDEAPAATHPASIGSWQETVGRYVRPATALKIAVWTGLQFLFYRLEFGLVFFIASCFYWVWDSMSSSSSTNDGERVSAYSVFNRGVTALPGTLNANEFDNMMRGGFAPTPGEEGDRARPDHRTASVEDWQGEEEDEAAQRAALASFKHRKQAEKKKKVSKLSRADGSPTTKARTSKSTASSSSSTPKPLVFDSDLQALLRSVAKP